METKYGYITYVEDGTTLYIMDVFVKEEYRGQGYGTAMTKEVVSYARHNGFKEVTVDAASSVMEKILRKLGFEEDGSESGVGRGFVLEL